MYRREEPDFEVKIFRGENSIEISKTDSGILKSIQADKKVDPVLVTANVKQYLSYHMIRIISDSYKYFDKDLYNLVNQYIYSLNIEDFIERSGGDDALKLNLTTEVYKISQLLFYYGKTFIDTDVNSIREEIDAMVTKLFRSIK